MKIGIVLISEGWSGAENAFYNLSKQLIKENEEVYLLVNTEIFKYYKTIAQLNLYPLGYLHSKKKYLWPWLFYKLRKNIIQISNKNKLDVLLLVLEDTLIPAYKLHKKLRIPIFLALRGEEMETYHHGRMIARYFLKKSLADSNQIISVNNWQISDLEPIFKQKTRVIPNGIDSKEFKPLKEINPKKNVILFVGKFIEMKGIREVINVAKQLPQYEFWFVGKGPLSNLITLSNTKNLGFKNKKELIKLYNQATVVVQPSYREGFSNVGLEVTACGRALICTPLGFSEYIENGKDGIIIPAKDEKALKEAIIKLMTNEKLRKRIEKNARKKALGYSWDSVAKQYIKIFKETVE